MLAEFRTDLNQRFEVVVGAGRNMKRVSVMMSNSFSG
jgi:hypothetical protein